MNGYRVVNGPSSHHVTIAGNEIFEIRAAAAKTFRTDGSCSATTVLCTSSFPNCQRRYDAVPLDIYSDRDGFTALGASDPAESTHHIVAELNEIHSNDNNSDCNGNPDVLVSTNVEHILVQANVIRDSASTSLILPQRPGITVRGERDFANNAGTDAFHAARRARKVVVRVNDIRRIYGIGIYVQSANNVLIERNAIRRAYIGVQVSTENEAGGPATRQSILAQKTWIRSNLIRSQEVWAIDLGRQAANYNAVRDIYASNNTVVSKAFSTSILRYQVVLNSGIGGDSKFVNNLIHLEWWGAGPCPTTSGGAASNYLFLRSTDASMTAVINRNLWFIKNYPSGACPTQPVFCRRTLPNTPITCEVFATYDNSHDQNGLNTDSLVYGPHTFLLPFSSTAIDRGLAVTPTWVTTNGANFGDYGSLSFPEADYYGHVRSTAGTGVYDIGMEEWNLW